VPIIFWNQPEYGNSFGVKCDFFIVFLKGQGTLICWCLAKIILQCAIIFFEEIDPKSTWLPLMTKIHIVADDD
jgi:hypothetical protein